LTGEYDESELDVMVFLANLVAENITVICEADIEEQNKILDTFMKFVKDQLCQDLMREATPEEKQALLEHEAKHSKKH
jgi:hypothetical protein